MDDTAGPSALASALTQLGWSDSDLARLVNVSRPAIAYFRTGLRRPRPLLAVKIANALAPELGLPPAQLGRELFPDVLVPLMDAFDAQQEDVSHV